MQSMTTILGRPQSLLTVAEVVERLRVSPLSVYRRIADGELDALRVGSGCRAPLRFRPEAVARRILEAERARRVA